MTKNIGTDAEIDRIRLTQQLSHPAAPAAGYEYLYLVSGTSHGGLFLKDSGGRQIGPFITGSASSGGAPTDAEYLLTAANGSLSAEVVIPGFAGSPDIAGAGGAGTSEEYDTSTTGITFDNAVTTVDSDTTALSHLYILITGDTNVHRGTKAWAPAGAFDVRTKIHIGGGVNAGQAFGLFINDNASADSNGAFIRMVITPGTPIIQLQAYTYSGGTPTQRGSTWSCDNLVYFRITRDGSNNVSFYFSNDGLAWQLINTVSFTFTPSRLGFRGDIGNTSDALRAYIDFLRTDV